MTTHADYSTTVPIEQFDTIGAWLAAARQARGLTRNAVGQAIGRHENTISHWERNVERITPTSCQLLAEFFHVPVNALIQLARCTVFDPNTGDDFGLWLKNARRTMELSQPQLGQAIGVSRSVINHVERNQYHPTPIVCARLANFFGVPRDNVLALANKTTISPGPKKQANDYPIKAFVAPPLVERPRGGCRRCKHRRQCREAVRDYLPMPCEHVDNHDVLVAQSRGLADVIRDRLGAADAA